MKLTAKASWLALTVTLLIPSGGILLANERQFSDGSVAAASEYHGDYYFDHTGKKVEIYRKKNTYVVTGIDRPNTASYSSTSLARFTQQHRQQISTLRKHNLPGAHVVRLQPRNQKSNSTGLTGTNLMSSVKGALPVFTSKSGLGDMMLLPKFTVQLSVDSDKAKVLSDLKKMFSLTPERQLYASGEVISFFSPYHGLEQFAIARRISQLEGVDWAEPQFFAKPQRATFEPNDPLFDQQWNLRNKGYRGSRCDADCDADQAWDSSGAGATTGAGSVIAIIDDGVQLDHPDLINNIYQNSGEIAENGIDDDSNGLVDDFKGYDFIDDSGAACGDDGVAGVDSDANPSAVENCLIAERSFSPDNHGTAVAGIAAAQGNNSVGISGVAFNAKILPVRAISDLEAISSLELTDQPAALQSQCNRIAEAVEYAAQHADVINLSWTLPQGCTALTQAIERTTKGEVTVGSGSKRTGGSPVIAASGNNASGWIKVTVNVPAGQHAYEWRYLRTSDDPPADVSGYDDTVWLDDITWPGGATQGFETAANLGAAGFSTAWVLNSCDANCQFNFGGEPVWGINTNPLINYARTGSKAASINVANASLESDCGNSYLHTLRSGPAGEMSFWVWVSANTQEGFDKFEFLIDGEEVISYGDLSNFGFVENSVGYPANLSDSLASEEQGVIAVGASTSGDLSGESTASLTSEYRVAYSQFGPELDIVAPSGDQHLGITTTDRTGDSGYNQTGDDDLGDRNYTQLFSGTSAAAPVVSGVAAAIIATDNTLTAQEVKELITGSADQIGNVAYGPLVNNGEPMRNDFFGFGRINMDTALAAAAGSSAPSTKLPTTCNTDSAVEAFDYLPSNDLLLSRYQPQASAGMCPALGRLPEDETCFAVRTSKGTVAAFCL